MALTGAVRTAAGTAGPPAAGSFDQLAWHGANMQATGGGQKHAAQVAARLAGRDIATPDDGKAAPATMAHRMLTRRRGRAANQQVTEALLQILPVQV